MVVVRCRPSARVGLALVLLSVVLLSVVMLSIETLVPSSAAWATGASPAAAWQVANLDTATATPFDGPTGSASSSEASSSTASETPSSTDSDATSTPEVSVTTASPSPEVTSATATQRTERTASPPAWSGSRVPLAMVVIAVTVLALTGLTLLRFIGRGTSPAETPHARPTSEPAENTQPERPAETAAPTVSFLVAAGEAMLDSDYSVGQIRDTLEDLAAANHMVNPEIVALPTALIVSANDGGGLATAVVTGGARPLFLHQIEDLDSLIAAARRGNVDATAGLDRIDQIRAAPNPFTPSQRLLGYVAMSCGLATLLGATVPDLLTAALLGAMVAVMRLLGERLRPELLVFVTVAAAFTVALSVFLLARSSLELAVLPAVVAPLVAFLPGGLLTTSVIELSTGQMVAGAGRLAAGGMQLLLLALGITSAAALVGLPRIDLAADTSPLGPVVPWVGVAVFGAGVVVYRCARRQSLGWVLLVLFAAYAAQVIGSLFLGGVLSAFIGALVTTPVAAFVAAQRSGPPPMVTFLPAFWLLVPGALGLVGVASILGGDRTGLTTLLTTVSSMVAIALGVLLGRAIVNAIRPGEAATQRHR